MFKKKEAIEVAQAVGQFAKAAPGSVTKIMLGVLEQAFTEMVIKPQDWASIDQEISATMQKGAPAGAAPAGPTGAVGPQGAGQTPVQGAAQAAGQQAGGQDILALAKGLPEQAKAQIMAMSQSGAPPQKILEFIKQQTGAA